MCLRTYDAPFPMRHAHVPATLDVPFSVPFRHRVTFTRGALAPSNAALRQAMTDGSCGAAVCAAVWFVAGFVHVL